MKHFCVFLLLCTLFVGCTSIEDEFNALNDNSPITRAINPHRTNPYVLSLVQDIANQVYIEHGCDSITLTPTDYYVCFTPKDSIQMETLWDLNVTLFNHPLDQLLSDQEIEAFRATHSMTYFAMIPATMTLPDTCLLNYQILDEAYILYPSQSTTRSFNAPTLRFYDEIYQRTLEATGNHATRTEVSEWIPSAHITYAEDKPGWEKNEPMPGVRVSVQDFYRVETKKTNKNGDTGAFGIFSNPVRYQIDWSDEKWEMSYTVPQNEVTSEISSDNTDIFPITDGPADSTEPWFYCVPPALQPHDSKDLIFAAAHKALYAYYYGEYPELTELTRLNFDEAVHVRIMFWYAADAGGRYGDNLVLLWPVWSDGKYIYKHHVVEMTLHELGHGAEDMIHNSLDYGYLEMAPAEAWANFHTYLWGLL